MSLIEAFNGSLLPLSEGLPLAPFLCKMLQCCSARLSSKIRKGKKIFHLKRGLNTSTILSPSEINHYRSLQEKISDTEHLFLNKIAESCDPEDASILSYHIQHAWIKEFIESAQGKLVKDKLRYDSFSLAIPPIDSSLRGYVQQPNRSENKHFSRLWAMAPSAPAWNGENTGPAAAFIADFRAVNAQFATTGEMGVAVHLKSGVNVGDDDIVMFEASPSMTHIVTQFAGKEQTSAISMKDFECLFKNHADLVRAITSDGCSDSAGASSSSLRVQAHHRVVDLQLLDNEYGCVCVIDVLFVGSTISLSSLRFRQQHGHDHIFGDTMVSSSTFRSASVVLSQSGISAATDLADLNMRKKRRLEQSRQQATSTRPTRGLSAAADAKLIASRLTAGATAATESDTPDVNYSARSISLQRACGPFLLTSDKHQLTQHSDTGTAPSSGKRSRATSDSGDSVRGSIGENALAMLNEGIPFTRTSSGVSHGSISSVGSKDGLLIEEVLDREPVVNIVYTGHLIGQRESRAPRGSAADSTTSQEQVPLLSSTANKPTLLSATSTVGAPVTSSSGATSTSTALSRFRAAAASSASVVPISFDSILQSFLRVIPFHVIEIWVPVQLEHGGTVLLYGGSAALDKELHGWSNYSRNFSFNPDVGLPGRVAAGRTAESSNDVSKLPVPQFLRAEMAGELGIHAACGLPFFTGNKCDAVVVFYSRHVFEPSKGLIEYMGKVCESLNIRAHIRVLQQEKQESIFK